MSTERSFYDTLRPIPQAMSPMKIIVPCIVVEVLNQGMYALTFSAISILMCNIHYYNSLAI